MDQTMITEFDSAAATYQKVIDLYPDHLVGYFYQAANLQSRMMDIEGDAWENEFYQWLDKAETIGKQMMENGDKDPWTFFYMGSVYSYKGLYQAKSGSLVQGFVSAKKGLGLLETAVEKDTTLYDAYLGLGSYKYYAGKYYKYLRWLPWISDEREEGMRMIQKSIQGGTFSYWVGVNTFGWIQYDRKEYDDALDCFLKGLQTYPKSRFFLWGAALCHLKLDRFEEAKTIYVDLLEHITSSPWNNGYNEIEARSKLAECYYGLGDYQKALDQCNAALERRVAQKIKKRLNEQYDLVKKIRKNSNKKLALLSQ